MKNEIGEVKNKEIEKHIFKRHKIALTILDIAAVGFSLVFFLNVGIKTCEMIYAKRTFQWCMLFAVCGINPLPYIACKILFERYRRKIERMGSGMQEFLSEAYVKERHREMQDPIDKIGCIGAVILVAMVLIFNRICPGIV